MAKNPLLIQPVKSPPMSSPGPQSRGIAEDHIRGKVVQSKEIVTDDHNSNGNLPQVVNVCYGTSNTVTASTVPLGTLFLTYTA